MPQCGGALLPITWSGVQYPAPHVVPTAAHARTHTHTPPRPRPPRRCALEMTGAFAAVESTIGRERRLGAHACAASQHRLPPAPAPASRTRRHNRLVWLQAVRAAAGRHGRRRRLRRVGQRHRTVRRRLLLCLHGCGPRHRLLKAAWRGGGPLLALERRRRLRALRGVERGR